MGASPKPKRGEFLIKRRQRRRAMVSAEQKAMQAAVIRDGRKCRNPRCPFKADKLPIDPAHAWKHRQMGGDKTGARTKRNLVIALCRGCHGLHGAGEIAVLPINPHLLADGPLCWLEQHAETGDMVHYFTEPSR